MELLKNEMGTYLIEENAFKQMTQIACKKLMNIIPAKKANDFVDVVIDDEGGLNITIHIRIATGQDLHKLCQKIQEEVKETIFLMAGVDCKNINIDIQGFISEKKA